MDDSHSIGRLSDLKRRTILALAKEHKKGALGVTLAQLGQQLRCATPSQQGELQSELEELIGQRLLEHGDDEACFSLSGAGIRIAKKLENPPPAALSPAESAPAERLTTQRLTVADFEFLDKLSRAINNFPAQIEASNLTAAEKDKLLSRAREFFEHPAVIELLRRGAFGNQ